MKKYLRKEIVTPLVTFLALCLYGMQALKLSVPVINGIPQESLFPLIIVIIGGVTAISLFVSELKRLSSFDGEKTEENEKGKRAKPVYVIFATAFLVFFFEKTGFFVTAFAYVFALMLIYDDKLQKIPQKLLFALLVCAFVYVLYVFVFDIRLPW